MSKSLVALLLTPVLASGALAQVNHNVSVQAFSFSPTAITVNVGDTVTWVHSAGFHTVTSGANSNPGSNPGALFDAPSDPSNTSFVYRVTSCGEAGNGVIPYFCRVHELFGMTGRITVRPILSSTGSPRIGQNLSFALNVPVMANKLYAMAVALGSTPGIPVGGGRILALNPDVLFLLTLGVNAPPFVGFGGALNGSGQASAQLQIPNMGQLIGLPVSVAYIGLDPLAPDPIGAVSNVLSFTFLP